MSEQTVNRLVERSLSAPETANLDDGPIDLEIGASRRGLRVLIPDRDLPVHQRGPQWQLDCLVIDTLNFRPDENEGFKGLRDGEKIILGRDSTYDRFNFDTTISRQHVAIQRQGSEIIITDLGSSNGTYLRTLAVHLGTVDMAGDTFAKPRKNLTNEDAFFVDQESLSAGVFDGIGSEKGSGLSAQLASETVADFLRNTPTRLPRNLARRAVAHALFNAHEEILAQFGNPGGTTATAMKLFETENGTPYAAVASVGDSRAYLYRDTKLIHKTLDQVPSPYRNPAAPLRIQENLSNVSSPGELAAMPDEMQAMFKNRALISGALGTRDHQPQIAPIDFSVYANDRILLTSDGVHDNLTSREIQAELQRHGSTEESLQRLIQSALRRTHEAHHIRRKPDDITATLVDI